MIRGTRDMSKPPRLLEDEPNVIALIAKLGRDRALWILRKYGFTSKYLPH